MFHKPRLRNRTMNGERARYVVGIGCLSTDATTSRTEPFIVRLRSARRWNIRPPPPHGTGSSKTTPKGTMY
ncbi:MAG: hypothetical protein FWE90_00480 [Defluviitaleaceae bacterium]|nr:hypothetical protein [Defluviitaleaceae bacterium]